MRPMYDKIYDNKITRNVGKAAVALLIGLMPSLALAEVPDWHTYYQATSVSQGQTLNIDEDYALGVDRFDLDEHTEVIGWQLSQRWYFGRQDGLDSGLTFVWQQNARQQVSVSKEGLRLTRRF